jgi:hypothetical protein
VVQCSPSFGVTGLVLHGAKRQDIEMLTNETCSEYRTKGGNSIVRMSAYTYLNSALNSTIMSHKIMKIYFENEDYFAILSMKGDMITISGWLIKEMTQSSHQ